MWWNHYRKRVNHKNIKIDRWIIKNGLTKLKWISNMVEQTFFTQECMSDEKTFGCTRRLGVGNEFQY